MMPAVENILSDATDVHVIDKNFHAKQTIFGHNTSFQHHHMIGLAFLFDLNISTLHFPFRSARFKRC